MRCARPQPDDQLRTRRPAQPDEQGGYDGNEDQDAPDDPHEIHEGLGVLGYPGLLPGCEHATAVGVLLRHRRRNAYRLTGIYISTLEERITR